MILATLVFLAALLRPAAAAQEHPNIVLILADDFGWANAGYNRRVEGRKYTPNERMAAAETRTPTIDHLADSGVVLDRHYAYRICGPSRASLQSGRLAVHVSTENTSPLAHNASNERSGYQGVALGMTCMGNIMQDAGYQTHLVGKWDAGMATPEHSPYGRGYSTWTGFFHHSNDKWTKGIPLSATGEISICGNDGQDYFRTNDHYRGGETNETALDHECWNPEKKSNHDDPKAPCYIDNAMARESLQIIERHDPAEGPLFLFHSFHYMHSPLEIPNEALRDYLRLVAADLNVTAEDFEDDAEDGLQAYEELMHYVRRYANGEPLVQKEGGSGRLLYAAMALQMDHVVRQLSEAIKDAGMWSNTLVVFTSDNGGPIYQPGDANNFPLKGGKFSDWEGGHRTPTFISGGYVPEAARGTTYTGVVSEADWLPTFAGLAGVSEEIWSDRANIEGINAAGAEPALHAVDGHDVWGEITTGGKSPWEELHLSENALLRYPWKLVTGNQHYATHPGVLFPTCAAEKAQPPMPDFKVIGATILLSDDFDDADCGAGCLFNIEADPSEAHDLALEEPEMLREMQAALTEANTRLFPSWRGEDSPAACDVVYRTGFYGPFLDAPTLGRDGRNNTLESFYTERHYKPLWMRVRDREKYLRFRKFTEAVVRPVTNRIITRIAQTITDWQMARGGFGGYSTVCSAEGEYEEKGAPSQSELGFFMMDTPAWMKGGSGMNQHQGRLTPTALNLRLADATAKIVEYANMLNGVAGTPLAMDASDFLGAPIDY